MVLGPDDPGGWLATNGAAQLIAPRCFRYLASACVAGLGWAAPASASWLDTDFYCRVYGCVVVHDGVSFDVYDNYIFATGGTVQPGSQMIPWSGNPFQGVGPVNPVFTGTRTEGFHNDYASDEGVLVGIDMTGNGEIDLAPTGASDGVLDASAVFQAFDPDSGRLVAADDESLRSFYLSSRTDFYLHAEAIVATSSDGELGARSSLSRIAFDYGVTRSGADDGMAFGSDARRGNYIRDIANATTLDDIYGGSIPILEFRNAIRQRASNDLPDQSVRFDYTYGFRGYDLSLGAGALDYQLEFDFYNR
ncbi:MAG: hypothetical protein AAFQ85_04230 [Pseudomonadota bacterium]